MKKRGGYVYVVRAGTTNRYKIGITRNLRGRLSAMQTDNPFEVKLVDSLRCDDPEAIESELHARFEKHNVHGEWFTLDFEQARNALSGYRNGDIPDRILLDSGEGRKYAYTPATGDLFVALSTISKFFGQLRAAALLPQAQWVDDDGPWVSYDLFIEHHPTFMKELYEHKDYLMTAARRAVKERPMLPTTYKRTVLMAQAKMES